MKLLVVIFYASVIATASLLIETTALAERQYRALIETDAPGSAAGRASRALLERLTFGLYQGAHADHADRTSMQVALAATERNVVAWSASLVALTAVSLGIGGWRWRQSPHRRRVRANLGLHLCGCAAVFLVVGVTAPILTIVAHQEVALLGRVVLSHETKSFVGTVDALLASGDWPVAALLALFSLAVPVTKLALTAAALACQARERAPRFTGRAHTALHHLGRWSMTDVFVVAILVAFFATREGGATEASIGPGLYFFAAHTVLAVVAGMLAPAPRSALG